jgi:hypothetical protein
VPQAGRPCPTGPSRCLQPQSSVKQECYVVAPPPRTRRTTQKDCSHQQNTAVSRVAAAKQHISGRPNHTSPTGAGFIISHVRGKFTKPPETTQNSSQNLLRITDTTCGRPLSPPSPPRTLSSPHKHRISRDPRCSTHFRGRIHPHLTGTIQLRSGGS